ncbi:hypothetical protein niasHT_035202 [Heterodera trifolii]|uniref:JmjC domain-containing protein n=1 Tax=Heterodera trifolii TaxID=157864 RepID=A0ABD2IAI4_9BILA
MPINNLWSSFALSDDGNELEQLEAQRKAIDAKIAEELVRRQLINEGTEANSKGQKQLRSIGKHWTRRSFHYSTVVQTQNWCRRRCRLRFCKMVNVVCSGKKWLVISGEWRGDNFGGSKNGGHGERRQKKNGETRENGYEYCIRTVLTTTNLGTEILAFTDESEAGIESAEETMYYGSQWFAPPAETTDSYRKITQLMESCNGPYVKMTSLPDDARMIRGLCAPPATSAFALHREEEHVHHLNYKLGPGLKLWLFVVGQWEKKAMELGKSLFGDLWPRCRNPLGHNSFFFSPAQLRKAGIPFEFHIQRPGDAVLTVGLHCGINVGASVCLVKELCNHRAATQFKLIGQKTRCDCRSSREFYQYSEEQSQEYLQGVKEMESTAKEKARKVRYEQSGHRERTTSKEQLASQRREQRARQKAEGRVPVPKTKKDGPVVINLDETDLD